ncbi:MAG: DNA methyltransferase, partial [Minisyncoccia bacterium]
TKYFKDIELDILSLFDDLDNELDGWLIHSENYQALNTILSKFKERIQTIYIDPPFNTGKDFLYKDNFQDSNWLTLIENRIKLANELLNESGSIYVNFDTSSNYRGRELFEEIFGKENFLNEIVWNTAPLNVAGFKTQAKNWIYAISTIYLFCKNKKRYKFKFPRYQIPKFIYNYFEYDGEDEFGKYRMSRYGEKIYIDKEQGDRIPNVWNDILSFNYIYVASDESFGFLTQKPERLLKRIIESISDEGEIVLDFFLGSGTTTAVAHKLKRKWIGIEMGEYFFTIVLPRIKKVLTYDKSGISKEEDVKEKYNENKAGGFFKYFDLEQYEDSLNNIKIKDN